MDELALAERLHGMEQLLQELAEDNTLIASKLHRIEELCARLSGTLTAEMDRLRGELIAQHSVRALRDLARSLLPPLAAADRLLAETGDFPGRTHMESIATALRHALARHGVEQISVAAGLDSFEPGRHACVGLVSAEDSPFPGVPPHTVVRVVEEGFSIHGQVVEPARVEVQGPAAGGPLTARAEPTADSEESESNGNA